MDSLVLEKERFDAMREVAIQEKDLTFQWRGGKGKLLYVKLKKAKTQEAWVNGQITKQNIHDIDRLKIIKKGRAVDLAVNTSKTAYRRSFSGKYDAPVFYIATEITKPDYDRIFQ